MSDEMITILCYAGIGTLAFLLGVFVTQFCFFYKRVHKENNSKKETVNFGSGTDDK